MATKLVKSNNKIDERMLALKKQSDILYGQSDYTPKLKSVETVKKQPVKKVEVKQPKRGGSEPIEQSVGGKYPVKPLLKTPVGTTRESAQDRTMTSKEAAQIAAPVLSFVENASFGLIKPKGSEEIKAQAPVASAIGGMGGYLLPGTGLAKGVRPLLTNYTGKFAKNVAEGALVGTGYATASNILGNKPLEEGLPRLATDIATGVVADVGLGAIGRVAGSIAKKIADKARLSEIEKIQIKNDPTLREELKVGLGEARKTGMLTPEEETLYTRMFDELSGVQDDAEYARLFDERQAQIDELRRYDLQQGAKKVQQFNKPKPTQVAPLLKTVEETPLQTHKFTTDKPVIPKVTPKLKGTIVEPGVKYKLDGEEYTVLREENVNNVVVKNRVGDEIIIPKLVLKQEGQKITRTIPQLKQDITQGLKNIQSDQGRQVIFNEKGEAVKTVTPNFRIYPDEITQDIVNRVNAIRKRKTEYSMAELKSAADRISKGKPEKYELDKSLMNIVREEGYKPKTATVGKNVPVNKQYLQPKFKSYESDFTFYRGTNKGDTRRINEPFEAGKGKTFVARKESSAKAYGKDIEIIKSKPNAKILFEESPEFKIVTERKRYNSSLPLMNQLRKNETIIDAVNDSIIKAQQKGYDAISFKSDSDIGTVILNEDAFVRNYKENKIPSIKKPSTTQGVLQKSKYEFEQPTVPLLPAPKKILPKLKGTKTVEPTLQAKIEPTLNVNKKVDTTIGKPVKTNVGQNKSVKTKEQTKIIDTIIKENEKERKFANNVKTSEITNDDLRKSFEEKTVSYEPITNKETLDKAVNLMNEDFDSAYKVYQFSKGKFNSETVPFARLLANKAAENGNIELSRSIITDTAEDLTKAGQFIQAAKILRTSNDPGSVQMFLQRQLNSLNEQGSKQYGKKWKKLELTDDDIKKINASKEMTEQQREALHEEIFDRITEDMPVSFMEKFDAFRRMAMLFNPKTHIRNIIGNGLMKGLDTIKDTMAMGIEQGLKNAGKLQEGQLTKSIGYRKNKELVKAVENSWNEQSKDLIGQGRWDIENLKVMNREKRIFKNKYLNFVDELSKGTLNAEDVFFLKRAYKDSLGNYMQANKMSVPDKKAIDYAKNYAMEATFRQSNILSNFISQAKQVKGVGRLVEAAIPFSKTPTNIMARAVDYSPIGLVKTLFVDKTEPSVVIDQLSKGLTGSALTALGFYLADMGWARGEYNKNKGAEGLLESTGEKPFSINTPGGSFTFDWAQPVSVPLAMGIVARESLKEDANLPEAVYKGIAAGGDTIINQTMLRNIKDILGGSGSPTEKIIDLPISYLEQVFPTVGGQLARTIDPNVRSTYSESEVGKTMRTAQSKIPFATKGLEPKVDIFGKEITKGTVGERALQQFILPGTLSKTDNDPAKAELKRLYKSTKETGFIPKVAPTKITNKKVTVNLMPKEVTEFQKKMGTMNYEEVTRLIKSPKYKSLTEEQKLKMIQNIVDDNYNDVKKEFIKIKKLK